MPEKLERCVMKVMSDPKFKPKSGDKKSAAYAVCTAAMKKGMEDFDDMNYEELSVRTESLHDVKINYDIPISESKKEDVGDKKVLKISGEAVREIVSRNKIKYLAEELKSSFKSLEGRPILDTHNKNSIKSALGRVTNVVYEGGKVLFDANIMDPDAIERIEDGRINNVSVGANVSELKKEIEVTTNESGDEIKNTVYVAKGIEFLELSLVTVPGIPTATIYQALNEAYTDSVSETEQVNINDFKKLKSTEEYEMSDEKVETSNGLTLEQVKELFQPLSEKLTSLESELKSVKESEKLVSEKVSKAKLLETLAQLREDGADVPEEEEAEKEPKEVLQAIIQTAEKNFKKEVKGKLAPKNVTEKYEDESIIVERTKSGINIYGKVDHSGNFVKEEVK